MRARLLLPTLALLTACATTDTGAASAPDEPVDTAADTARDDTGRDSGVDSVPDTAPPDDTGDTGTSPDEPELWVYATFNLQTDTGRLGAINLVDRAANAGYHGLVLADFKFHLLHTELLTESYPTNVRDVVDYAHRRGLAVVPAVLPFGYSEGILYEDPNLAEGRPVTASYRARGGELVLEPGVTGPDDPGFERHSGAAFTAWDWQDERVVADTAVSHGGAASARMDAGSGNARVVRSLELQPHRQYHVSWWMKTSSYAGFAQVTVLDRTTGAPLTYGSLDPASTQDWTRYDLVFDSGDSTGVRLYVGVWGDMRGTAWFDDVHLDETGLVNVLRREGTPLVIRGDDGTIYVEGVDVAPVADPSLSATFDEGHAAPVPRLLAGTRVAEGARVHIDHYVVQRIYGYQVGACLSDPAVDDWMDANLGAVADTIPQPDGLLLGYDEMRHVNTCAACAARGLDAGELVAAHVETSTDRVRALWPDATPWVWSDMFDPFHNAHDDYYLVDGDLAGSWEGLDPATRVLNWNIGNHDSLVFFADRGHTQIIAGYYDAGDGTAAALRDLAAAEGVPGVRGLMYTTWGSDWAELEAYADAARAAWRP